MALVISPRSSSPGIKGIVVSRQSEGGDVGRDPPSTSRCRRPKPPAGCGTRPWWEKVPLGLQPLQPGCARVSRPPARRRRVSPCEAMQRRPVARHLPPGEDGSGAPGGILVGGHLLSGRGHPFVPGVRRLLSVRTLFPPGGGAESPEGCRERSRRKRQTLRSRQKLGAPASPLRNLRNAWMARRSGGAPAPRRPRRPGGQMSRKPPSLTTHPHFCLLRATREGRVLRVDEGLFSRPGPGSSRQGNT